MANASVTPIQPIDPLTELQNSFALIKLSGELRVVDRNEVARLHAGVHNGGLSLYRQPDAKILMRRHLENLPIASDTNKAIGDLLASPNTTLYDEVAFSPLPTPPSTLNLWVGPTVDPAHGNCAVVLKYLLDVVCAGDRACYEYLIRFLAHMVQRPEEKPGIMPVLLGGQGTGKGTYFQLLKKIWSHSILLVSDVSHVVGGYNAALEHNYVVCMDEALFSGDRKAADRLKSLITEPTITIEAKYQPRRTIQSYHRYFAASNRAHFAQVDEDDRRFLFLRVSEEHKGDYAYWDAFHSAISDPATIAAFLFCLQRYPLGDFNVRQRPTTSEHMDQKLRSLTGFDRYWYECLQVGKPTGAVGPEWAQSTFVSTENLQRGLNEYQKGTRRWDPPQGRDIRTALERLCPSATKQRRMRQNRQERGYILPSLPDARAEFAAAMGGEVDWDN